ncbi:type IV prepilin-like proteins leader peptide processing enzyme, partial [Vibrio alginolyticus 12G01]
MLLQGYLCLWSVYWGFTATVTGKEGMGYGDFKLHSSTR